MSAPAEVNFPTASQRDPAGEIEWSPRRWMALAVLIAAGFMDLLDTTIVNVAIPSIRNSLRASYAEIQWIVAGYLLALAVGLITGGRLGDIAGRKRVFTVGVVAFGLTSLASGLAPTGGVLVVTRLMQGLSAAIMIPQILSVVQVSFPRREQPRALALYSSVAGVAVMSGPLLAGVLLDVFHFSWRSIFLINVPVTVIVVLAAAAVVPESKARKSERMDPGGVALVSAALFALVFGIIEGRQFGWPPWTLLLMVASVPLFILFARYESRYERHGHSPIVSPELFRHRTFSSGMAVIVVFFTGVVGFFLAFTVFLQLGLGYTPLESALTTFPSSVGLAVASLASAKLVPRFGSRVLAVGALVMATAMAGLLATVHLHGAALTAWEVRPVILVFGLGMGLIIPPLAEVVLAGVDERHAGAASGVVNTGMQVGNAMGVAIVGVILFSAIAAQAPKSVATVQPELSRQLTAAGVPAPVRDAAVAQFGVCFVDQSRQEDPAAVPTSCRRDAAASLPSPIREKLFAALDAASERGRAEDFVASIQRALLYEVGVFVVTVVLLLLLPFGAKRRRSARGEGAPAAPTDVGRGRMNNAV